MDEIESMVIGQAGYFLCRVRPDQPDEPLDHVTISESWKRFIMSFDLDANIDMIVESKWKRLYVKAETVEIKKRKSRQGLTCGRSTYTKPNLCTAAYLEYISIILGINVAG